MKSKNNLLLYIFGATVLIFAVTSFLDRLVQEGMFFDGITYASISRNLSIGNGSFWNVHYRGDWRFAEHPPLMFGIQAIFFKILGDSFYTEKVYCFVVWLATVLSLRKLWAKTTDNETAKAFSLPLFCWVMMPSVMWSYPSNLLDTTMALLDIWAVYFLFTALQNDKIDNGKLALGGLFIYLATLTKGPVGFFPLAVPILYQLTHGKHGWGKTIAYSFIPLVTVSVLYGATCAYEPARTCLNEYLNEQVFKAVAGQRDVVDSKLGRYQLLYDIAEQSIPAICLAILLYLIAKLAKAKIAPVKSHKQLAIFYLLLALCGSLPIVISLKQRTFYLTPVFPYFAFAIALTAYPAFAVLMKRASIPIAKNFVNALILVASLGAAGYVATRFGKIGRDEAMITDVRQMQQLIPEGEKIGICRAMDRDYTFLAYIQRYHKLEVKYAYHKTRYVLIDKNACSGNFSICLARLGYKVKTSFSNYDLYVRDYSANSPLPDRR
jgi:hypothetical protein